MELILNELDTKPNLCLNMIVKDESHIIVDTLTKLLNKIKFDYWVISDTGSTDNTKELITEFFKNRNIKGELFEDKWQDFGYNRTKALEHAYNKSKYVLIFDADDEIVGDFVLPELTKDSYFFQFGSEQGTSYIRIQIVNNRKKWKYVGVLHEIITCVEHSDSSETIIGNYFTVSGRTSSRNRDENKYLKDALILEKAYEECIKNNDTLYHRYGFYCANSYFDSGKWEDAIKWYKITLNNDNWSQEKYMCCLRLFQCYNNLKNTENGIFYLIKSFEYDKERVECLYELVVYYCLKNLNDVAYGFYSVVKDFFNNKYISVGVGEKLFLDLSKPNFYLPYYMILVADKMKDNETIIKMYKIAFTKKYIETNTFFVGNLLYNLQFFIESAKNDQEFLDLFNGYIVFLKSINYPIHSHEFMKKFEQYGIKVCDENISNFSQDECIKSKNILFYTGYSNCHWNYTYSLKNALGGSETAVINLIRSLPSNYKIYIGGDVAEEKVDNITFYNLNSLRALAKTIPFHTVIVSRYIGFYEMFSEISFYQSFIWGHDIILFHYGCPLDTNSILKKWNKKINKCICQTEWHKNRFLDLYPELNDKIITINNGICIDKFIYKSNKIANKFIYTSCSERGLDRLLELWPQIIENLPDAELSICSYNKFPSNEYEKNINEIINKHDSITHLGCLNKDDLYKLMSTAEYWLYPTNFDETSCITSMEMLMSEVICIYYPRAGLVNTLCDYGIPVERGNEIDTILNLSNKEKISIRKRGKEYALSCSWENRCNQWCNIVFNEIENVENENIKINLIEIETPRTETTEETIDKSPEKYIIKIVNLKNRNDRRNKMIEKLNAENVYNYEFFEAINGKTLNATNELICLFERNDFGYKRGVIGCALSHLFLWKQLTEDDNNNFYVILEDDIELCKNFKVNLEACCKLFIEQKLEHLSLGEYFTTKSFPDDTIEIKSYNKDLYKEWNVTFGYIISKSAAKKAIDYVNKCSIKCAFDNPQAFGYILNYSALNVKLVKCEIVNEYGSDIQSNSADSYFYFIPHSNNKKELTISFCDWWHSEYCGGTFDVNNNFFTNLLTNYGNNCIITPVQPDQNPDILFYSIFGNSHQEFPAKRKIFFCGEPYSQRENADFNLTFDKNSLKNTRIPLWLCYMNNNDIQYFNTRKFDENSLRVKTDFCSFIATGPGLENNRKEFVEKLSKYKQVDCGGEYLNNIGYNVPLGTNCSGKIEHNRKYKFAMAFESKSYPGYVTEKICDIFKSNTIPIYWGTKDVIKDFNPKSFINANDFSNFDELIEYIIKVDNDDQLYLNYFKEHVFSNQWIDIFNDNNKCFYKNIADNIIKNNNHLFDSFFENYKKEFKIKKVNIFNIWHNKLFDKCYEDLDDYSISKINMFDVNPSYEKIYNKDKNYKIIKEYELQIYDNILQATNYCQTSCLYHVYVNGQIKNFDFLYDTHYIGFIQYDMELANNFIYDIEEKINSTENDVFFYSLIADDKLERDFVCKPLNNSILEKYNNFFNTNHTYQSIKNHEKSKYFICLHTFVIPIIIYMKMMNWYCSISDWLHVNYINGIYTESMSEVTEEIFGLFLLLQIIENNSIQLEELKLKHNWPNLHNETSFNNYKENINYFPLSTIINNNLTDKNSYHSYIDIYENLFKNKQLTTKNVLEIGIERGGSLKLWNDYFVNAKIYGLDINEPPEFLTRYERIISKKFDAYSLDSFNYFIEKNIKFDIIIDDGSHTLESMIFVIEKYTKLLDIDGILIIEDVQAIEWCEYIYNKVSPELKEFSYHIDRRHVKGTLDDILFIIQNKDTNKNNKSEVDKININLSDLWIVYAFPGHNYKVIEDYINNLSKRFNIVYTQDIEYILTTNPKKISYLMYIVDTRLLDKFKNSQVELSFLNTEPLSIEYNLNLLKSIVNKYPYLKIYDYSSSNVQIILNNNMYAETIEYIYDKDENDILTDLNKNTEKIYDFGIITYGNTQTNTCENSLFHKKKDIVLDLIGKGFKIHIISGWGKERDQELAKCKVILNIHSILRINDKTYYSKTFENIRCNRLLDAGYKVLSEDSIYCNNLINKYKNLKFIDYEKFKNIEYTDNIWDKIENNKIKNYCFIHSCNIEGIGTYRLEYLINKLNTSGCTNIFEKIYINNIGLPIKNDYGEKFEIINYSEDTQLFEIPTINFIKNFSEINNNCYILYIHTKGIRYSNNDIKENDWIDYMLYFLVEKYKICISILDNYYDVIGCNYSNDLDKECFKFTNPFPPPHYNGNFWWANTNYLTTLPQLSIHNINRNDAEFWLFKNNPKFYNLHSSNVNHYQSEYPSYLYVDNST